MAKLHELTVTKVRKTTRDAVVASLEPTCAQMFPFVQGQYLTFAKAFEDIELRRSYSICSAPCDGMLQVGIKRVEGGCFSTWANTKMQPGDTLQALLPTGNFFTPLDSASQKSYIMFAVGSGITPILSLIREILNQEPLASVTLVFVNRNVGTIMFREELDDLKNLHLGRLSITHILKQDAQDIDLFTGRLTAQKCDALFKNWLDIGAMDQAFICGPEPVMQEISSALQRHGMPKEQIKYELFAGTQQGQISQKLMSRLADVAAKDANATASINVTIDGTSRNMEIALDGTTVLQAALDANLDAPFACRAGVCSTCRARVIEGEVEMLANHALEDYEVEQGYVLTCQSVPVSKTLVLSYDG